MDFFPVIVDDLIVAVACREEDGDITFLTSSPEIEAYLELRNLLTDNEVRSFDITASLVEAVEGDAVEVFIELEDDPEQC